MRVILVIGVEHLYDVTFFRAQFLLQEGWKVHLSDKTNALGIFFFSRHQIGFAGNFANFALEEMAYREHSFRELGLAEAAEKITLVFTGVAAFENLVERLSVGAFNRLSFLIEDGFLAAIVPGSHHVGAKFLGRFPECVEFDFAVAEDVGVWGAALGIFVEHIIDNPLSVLFG